jgi:glycosyltransferase involved in cell wall biosynthesis
MALMEDVADRRLNDPRSRGDRDRDAGNWGQAAEFYLEHLNSEPGDFPIWVQRGNCLKEAGNFVAAEEAYRSAIALRADDPDVHLQLGHLMKRTARLAAAIECYNRSLDLDPTQQHALRELKALGVNSRVRESRTVVAQRHADGPIHYFDIYDLIAFLRVHTRVTGIQRVVSCIVSSHLANSALDNNIEYCAILPDSEGEGLVVFQKQQLRDLLNYTTMSWVNREVLDGVLADLLHDAAPAQIRPNDVYVILGAFWIVQDYGVWLLRLKEKGVLIGTYIYDLIPMTHPQFVTESNRDAVNERFAEILLLSDFFLTISEYVARDVRLLLKSEANLEKPIRAVPLAHQLPKPDLKTHSANVNRVSTLAARPFVLSVCTLEGRKNHVLLHRAWSAMIRKHGAEKVPQLVLVGKWGWRIEEFVALCNNDNFLNGKIVVESDLGDEDLTYLYERCMFTVFPSFVEGWGLPVGESLAFGKPCLASNTTSIPEVGGDFVIYFDPHDPFGATEIIERAIFDQDFLARLTRRIEAEFTPRTWASVSDTFLQMVDECVTALRSESTASPSVKIPIAAGKLYRITGAALIGRSDVFWSQKLAKLVRYSGWHPLESWGCWSSTPQAQLRLNVGDAYIGQAATVYLELRLPRDDATTPEDATTPVIISDNGPNSTTITSLQKLPKWIKFKTNVDHEGFLHIYVETRQRKGKTLMDDPRNLFVGFSGIGYHLNGDIASRLGVIEDLLLGTGALYDQ